MKYMKYISIVILTFFFYACEETSMPLFDATYSLIFIDSGAYSISENSTSVLEIPVVVGGVKGADVDVTFEIEGTGDNPAIEGTHYQILNADNKVTVANGSGIAMIQIKPLDNDVYDKNKTFTVRLVSNSAGFYMDTSETGNTIVSASISDNEHPLAKWIGTYEVTAVSYWSPGEYDETWDVVVSPSPEDESTLIMTGIAEATTGINATIDVENMTVTIEKGQTLFGEIYTYGDVDIVYGYSDLSFDKDKDIVGTISDDGSMSIDHWGHVLPAYGDYVWDVFNTIWTKQ